MSKLSYEQWRIKHPTTITNRAVEALKRIHNVDAEQEVENLMKSEYELYLSKENPEPTNYYTGV